MTGLAPPTGFPSGNPAPTRETAVCTAQTSQRRSTMTNASTKNGSNGVHPDAAITPEHDLLWDSLSPGGSSWRSPSTRAWCPAQGTGWAHIPVHRGAHRHRPGERDIWSRRLGIRSGRCHPARDPDPKTGEISRIRAYSAPVRVTVPGAPPARTSGSTPWRRRRRRVTTQPAKGRLPTVSNALRSFGDQFGNCLYGDQAATGQPAKRKAQPTPLLRRCGRR